LSVVIGIALNLATHQSSQQRDGWVTFRLFWIPFLCVELFGFDQRQGFHSCISA